MSRAIDVPKPGEVTNATLLKRQTAQTPDAPFGIFPDSILTFAQVDSAATEVAKGLIALGVRPGDHVATLMPNHADWLAAYFGILYAGATIVALNARYKRQELAYTIGHSDARLLITTDATLRMKWCRTRSTRSRPRMPRRLSTPRARPRTQKVVS